MTGLRGALLLSAMCYACTGEQAETYGFVATLGNDTTSVERVTRTGNRVVIDAVGRSPLVMRRHWEATLAEDGTIARWTLDTEMPNATGATQLHHEADFTGNTVSVLRIAGTDTMRATWSRAYAVAVPWNAFLYSSYELLFQASRGLPDSTRIGQYFFEGWAEGRMGHGQVRALGDNRYSISSTGLAGAGVAQLDSARRLLSYSGQGTTYRQEVRRVDVVPDIDALAARFAAEEKAAGVQAALSLRDTVRAQVGAASMSVEYSRPRARGRVLLGELIPYDRVWRTGANAATHFHTPVPIRIGGFDLDSGTYTLWTLPRRDGVSLIINRQTGQWGTGYGAQHDVARLPMQQDSAAAHVEQFTIRIEPDPAGGASRGLLVMEWGAFRWSVPLEVQAREGG